MTSIKSADQVFSELQTESKVPETPEEKANREVDEMYQIFKTEIDIDTVMTESEFEEYKPLFSAETRMQANDRQLSMNEVLELADLSQRFADRINTHRPVHVIDDSTREELFTLPPVYNKLHPIANDKSEIIDAYRNYNDPKMLAQNGGPIMDAKKNAINQALTQSLIDSQPVEELQRNMTEFETLAAAFHKKVLGNNPFDPEDTSGINKDETIHTQATSMPASGNTDNDYDDDFDF
jgi:hypothetical protein